MSYKIWNSYRDFTEAPDQINELFGEFLLLPQDELHAEDTWAPPIDIYEEGNFVVLTADMPGVDQENIHIQMEQNELVLFGKRTIEDKINSERYHRIELTYGKFRRSFPLFCKVDQENIKAKLYNGVLTIFLPKA